MLHAAVAVGDRPLPAHGVPAHIAGRVDECLADDACSEVEPPCEIDAEAVERVAMRERVRVQGAQIGARDRVEPDREWSGILAERTQAVAEPE